MSAATENAERGAALLDELLPGWREWIDPDTLALESDCDCVLGQLFGRYIKGVSILRLDAIDVQHYGFTRQSRGQKWPTLTNAWKRILK